MKIFLCWSGDQSQKLAKALRWWLPVMNPAFQTWLSSDISHGDRWVEVMRRALADSSWGIVCVTPDSLASRWLMFEAGALVGAKGETHVVPYLLHIDKVDVKGTPLGFFQSTSANYDGTFQLVTAMNSALPEGSRHPEAELHNLFESLWSRLDSAISQITASSPPVMDRDTRDAIPQLTTELHDLNRGQGDLTARLTDLEIETREGLSTTVELLSRIVTQLEERHLHEDSGEPAADRTMAAASAKDNSKECTAAEATETVSGAENATDEDAQPPNSEALASAPSSPAPSSPVGSSETHSVKPKPESSNRSRRSRAATSALNPKSGMPPPPPTAPGPSFFVAGHAKARDEARSESKSARPSTQSKSMAPSRKADSATPLSQPPEWSAVLADHCLEHATLQDLAELIVQGRITPDTPVRKEGMSDFCEARKFMELRAAFPEAATEV